MTGWLAFIGLALLTAAFLIAVARPSSRLIAIVAIALAAGLGGYAVQGNPALAGRPTPPRDEQYRGDTHFAKERGALLENLGNVGGWLNFADALQRAGMTRESVNAMKVATRAFPDSPDLWVGLGNALIVHGDGFVSPAARLAFARAARIAPGHPAPPYFLGMAWLQAGQPDEALKTWQELRGKSPPAAPWLPELDRKIAAAEAMLAAGVSAVQ